MTPSAFPAPLGERYDSDLLSMENGFVHVADSTPQTESPLLLGTQTDATRLPVLLHELTALRDALTAHDAQFGALFAPGVTYVFEPVTTETLAYERTLPSLPDSAGTVETDARPFDSARELSFCFHRLYNLTRPNESMSVPARKRKFRTLVRAIDGQAQDAAPPDEDFEQAVAAVFEAFDLEATDRDVLAGFVAYAAEVDSIQRFSTRPAVADFLVELAGVEADETVFDPASGMGTILRAADAKGATGIGIEIDEEIAEIARFCNDLLDIEDIAIQTDNFLESPDAIADHDVDHIILEPPSTRNPEGERVGSLVTRQGAHIEEQILEAAAACLQPGTTLTALVPFGMLVRPDSEARAFRRRLREDYRIRALFEVINPDYYPYPGVRTGILQLEPRDDDADGDEDEDVQVARLVAAGDSGRFEAAEGKPLETLFEETLTDIEADAIETVPLSAFGEILDPSDALRRRDLEATLEAAYDQVATLETIATDITRGPSIPQHELDDEGTPYLRIATMTGHETDRGYVADPAEEWVATSSDLLVSVKGTVGLVHVPEEPVVPSADWAIVRLGSAEAATTYRAFFETTLGSDVQEALEASGVVPYPRYTPELTLPRLRAFVLPVFDAATHDALAAAIAELGADRTPDALDDVFDQHAE